MEQSKYQSISKAGIRSMERWISDFILFYFFFVFVRLRYLRQETATPLIIILKLYSSLTGDIDWGDRGGSKPTISAEGGGSNRIP